MTQATVLILGGTTEARELAGRLATRPGLRVVTSLAGRTREPAPLAGEVRTALTASTC
jgi:precorrin-6A/cobalt-precorrin-6A reductase